MEIVKFKKIGNSKYKLFLNENEIILYEDVILKYNLLVNKNLDLKMMDKILEDNRYYEIYNLALKYIDTKMRSKKELEDYLGRKEIDYKTIQKVIEELEKNGFINETQYIKSYINDKVHLSKYGPFKIKQDLLNMGMDETEVDDYLNAIEDGIWVDKIKRIIKQKEKSNNNKSSSFLKNKVKQDLFNMGYQTELINEELSNINGDDEEIYNKEKEKAYKKYSKKYSGYELEQKIKLYLMSRGFFK